MFFIGFPLLLVPFAIYNIIAFLMPGVSFTEPVMTLELPSAAEWRISGGDLLHVLAILLLYLEILKLTRLGTRSLVDHILSLILFIAMAGEFLIVARAGTSTFFILVVLSLVDAIAGFSAAVHTAQRDVAVEAAAPVAAANVPDAP